MIFGVVKCDGLILCNELKIQAKYRCQAKYGSEKALSRRKCQNCSFFTKAKKYLKKASRDLKEEIKYVNIPREPPSNSKPSF